MGGLGQGLAGAWTGAWTKNGGAWTVLGLGLAWGIHHNGVGDAPSYEHSLTVGSAFFAVANFETRKYIGCSRHRFIGCTRWVCTQACHHVRRRLPCCATTLAHRSLKSLQTACNPPPGLASKSSEFMTSSTFATLVRNWRKVSPEPVEKNLFSRRRRTCALHLS